MTAFPKTLLALALATSLHAQTVTLNTLDRSILVGQTDTNPAVAPVAPGNGWYTGAYAGTIRGRASDQFHLRTQWYFVLDISALPTVVVNPKNIVSATLSIPQIGRLNTVSYTQPSIKLYDPNYLWDTTSGTNYPVWNSGREAANVTPPYPGGTRLADPLGGYNTFGLVTDTSNPNVEGTFTLTNSLLADTVKSWVANPADNEGFFMSYENAHNMGLAFATPSLEITYLLDTDLDGMPDDYEDANGLLKNDPADASLDNDANGGPDGLTNLQEYNFGTDPNIADVDLDGLNDGGEFTEGTDPFDNDTDNDGLLDGQEVFGTLNPYKIGHVPGSTPGGIPGERTDPLDPDSDNDGLSDFVELDNANGSITNPNDQDTDGDTLFDDEEIDNGLDPTDATGNNGATGDPDMDSLTNYDEIITHGTDPQDDDSDDDLLKDGDEVNGTLNPYKIGHVPGTTPGGTPGEETDPLDDDSDNDGLTDFVEIDNANGSITNPNAQDTDGDTLLDGFEIAGGLDPTDDGTGGETSAGAKDGPNGKDGDPDADNLFNDEEQTAGSDPNDSDTDDDTLLDGAEVFTHFTSPILQDTDGDLIRDDEELVEGADGFVTSPTNGDTDDDGFKDFIEIQAGSDPEVDSSTPTFPAITWSAEDFNEVTDLSTEGTLLYAENFDGADLTINTIPFVGVSSALAQKSGHWLQTLLINQSSSTGGLGGFYDGEVPELTPLVTTFWFGPVVKATNYGLTGLTPGQTYLVQLGRVDDRTGTIIDRFMTADGYGGNLTTDPIGPTNTTYGGPANPAILLTGTFVAQYTVQGFVWSQYLGGATPGVDDPLGSHIPFIQVREIDPLTPVTVTDVRRTPTTAEVDFAGLNPAKMYQLIRSADLLDGFPTVVDGPRTPAGATDTFTDSSPLANEAYYQLEEMP